MIVRRIRATGTLSYPVGANPQVAEQFIDSVLVQFNKHFRGTKRPINIWCRGSSGSILATIFAVKCGRQSSIVYIRKEGETSHDSNEKVEVPRNHINIIIDDFVAFGDTLKEIAYWMDESEVEIDCIIVQRLNDLPSEIKTKYLIHQAGTYEQL